MLNTKQQLDQIFELNAKGEEKLFLSNLADFDEKNEKLRTFALAELKPGEEVELHRHDGECEYYYLLSGKGVYNDNNKETAVYPGTVTFTPSGSSHGIRNTGEEMLTFIALIIKD